MIIGYSEEIEKEIIDLIDGNIAPMQLTEIVDCILPSSEDEDSGEPEYEIDDRLVNNTEFVREILYQSYSIVSIYGKENYYWTLSLFENFIENSLTTYLETTHNTLHHPTVIECYNQVIGELKTLLYSDSTLKHYKDKEISFSYFFFEEEFNKTDFLLSKILEFFETDKRFQIKSAPSDPDNLEKALVYFTNEDVVKDHQILILSEIGKLLVANNNIIRLTDLIFRLNTTDLDTVFPRPFSRQLILNLINSYSEYLSLEDELVMGNRDIAVIVKQAIEESFPLEKSKASNVPGLVFFIFKGNEYPFENSIEYIKLRPVIYVANCIDCRDFINSFDSAKNEISIFLTGLFGEKEKVKDWLLNNVQIGVYKDYLGIRNFLYKQIIQKYSPVFNLSENPGNLFYSTLSKLLTSEKSNQNGTLTNE